jgi:hypothetical protein
MYLDETNKGTTAKCNIMIEDKYVAAFIWLCGDWYAVMRLFGKPVLPGVLADTEKNRVFFKLTNVVFDLDPYNPDQGTSGILFQSGTYELINKTTGTFFSSIPTIKLINGYEHVKKVI